MYLSNRFVVDPKNPLAVPSGLPKPTPPPEPADKFKVGDYVRLVPNCNRSSYRYASGSKKCLGKAKEGRVGIIVKISSNLYTDGKTKNARKFIAGENDNIYTVMGIKGTEGFLCEYPSSDLQYFDGTNPGELFPHGALTKGIAGCSLKRPTGVFNVGDKVMLRKSCSNVRGCLGEPSYKWVANVSSLNGSRISVQCYTARSGNYPQLSGNYPNYTYDAKDLIIEGAHEESSPLNVGDRVTLDPTFFKSHTDGFCLGKSGDLTPKVGVVLFAPPADGPDVEQREVIVAALDDLRHPYKFRASHLQRVDNIGRIGFCKGDRVQVINLFRRIELYLLVMHGIFR